MHLIKFSEFNKLFISIIFIICQVTNAIENISNDSISLQDVTDYYEYSSHSYGRARRQNTDSDQSCTIPNYPPHSTYKIISEPDVLYKSGDNVKQFSTLEISCDKGYNLPPFTVNISNCLRGQWNNLPPACLRTCPSLMSTTSTRVKCDYNNLLLENCIRPIDGTSVRLLCNEFYESDAIKKNPIRSCRNGRWTPNLSDCEPTCGLKSPKAVLTVINGRDAASGDYPWHVGLYTNTEEYRCGGSIINQNTILTAAHCVADNNGKAYPPQDYLIAAGKYHRQFRHNKDLFPQYANVRQIHVPGRYKSTQSLNSYDIAVITLEDPFTLTTSVQPVCTALNEEVSYENYLVNSTGIVAGWGYTQEGKDLSDVLKELIIPNVPYDECFYAVPTNFRPFFTSDKICGGYLNQGTSICTGDSGGGLVYNINDRYFIKGVVSTSPATLVSGTTQCNSEQYSLYTSVYYHIAFVRTLISNYGWRQSVICAEDNCANEETNPRAGCRLPSSPKHGKYSFSDQNTKYEPGNYVDTDDKILLTCDIGYEPNPLDTTNFICLETGIWNSTIASCTRLQAITNHSQTTNTVQEEGTISSIFNYFDFELLQLFDDADENYLVSPASIKIILALLLEGSKGKSAQEISQVLGIPVNVNSIRKTLNNLRNNLSTKFGNTVMNVGNLFAVNNKYALRQGYKNISQEHYNSQATAVNFTNSVQIVSYINNWAKSATKGFIGEVINAENLFGEISFLIINAGFFKAEWKFEFTQKVTTFFFIDKVLSHYEADVDTLIVKNMFRYRFVEELNTQAVELPYSDEEHAMLILLPKEKNAVNELQSNLLRTNFSSIVERLEPTEVLVSIPKFDVEYGTNLKPLLQSMGIAEIFSRNANLSGIIERGKVKVNKIHYKTKVEVNEKGMLPVAEASVIDLMDSSTESVIANRPFLFFIYNVISKTVLFEGRLNWPRHVEATASQWAIA